MVSSVRKHDGRMERFHGDKLCTRLHRLSFMCKDIDVNLVFNGVVAKLTNVTIVSSQQLDELAMHECLVHGFTLMAGRLLACLIHKKTVDCKTLFQGCVNHDFDYDYHYNDLKELTTNLQHQERVQCMLLKQVAIVVPDKSLESIRTHYVALHTHRKLLLTNLRQGLPLRSAVAITLDTQSVLEDQ